MRPRTPAPLAAAFLLLFGAASASPRVTTAAEGAQSETPDEPRPAARDTTAFDIGAVEVVGRASETSPVATERASDIDIRQRAGVIATDPLRVMQLMPGVALGADDFSNKIAVRGGDPEENVYVLDGFRLLQPSHLEGFTSVIYDDLVGGVDFHPAAYPVRYGEALSSITDVTLRRPRRARGFFRYDVGSMALGGETVGDDAILIGSARSTFYDLVIGRPFGVDNREFQDATVNLRTTGGPIPVSTTLLVSRDRENGFIDREVDSWLLGVRGGELEGDASLALSVAGRRRSETFENTRAIRADVDRFALAGHRVLAVTPALDVRTDAELRAERFDAGTGPETDVVGFASTEIDGSHGVLGAAAGVRAETLAFTRGTWLSPYASVRARVGRRLRAEAGWRRARQSPFSLEEVQAIGGLRIPSGELLAIGSDRLDPVTADLASLELTAELVNHLAISAVAYTKAYEDLVTWDAPTGPTTGDVANDDVANGGDGRSRGVDVSIRRRAPAGVTGSLTWSRARSRRREGASATRRPADYDRPDTFQASLVVPLGGGATLGIAYRRATGRPVAVLALNDDDEPEVIALNEERLPTYRRLDVKFQLETPLEVGDLYIYVDLLNLSNRENVVDQFYVVTDGRIETHRQGGVPITPLVGAGFYF